MSKRVDPLLSIEDLHIEFKTRRGVAHAVNGVSYSVDRGEMLAVLGESGSGKSVTAQAVMGILDTPPAKIGAGTITFDGMNLLDQSESALRRLRGDRISMVFQDALSALNPVAPVGKQIAEMFVAHRGASRTDAAARAAELMDQVGIPNAQQRAKEYPHQFSGGLRQRVMIAMALALDPDLLIADEPTTALDVTIQAQILELLEQLRSDRNMAVILITHDVGVVAEVADKVVVMYAGKIVESGTTDQVLYRSAHPYTAALLESAPTWERRGRPLHAITGNPPNLARIPDGCAFHPRCPHAQNICHEQTPPLVQLHGGQVSLCHFATDRIPAGTLS